MVVMTSGMQLIAPFLDNDLFLSNFNNHFCPACDTPGLGDWDQCCTGWCGDVQSNYLQPTPAKVIRLVFHDCMK